MATNKRPSAINKRKCHDCDNMTTNFRCPKCLKKWKQEHGVSGKGVESTTNGTRHFSSHIGGD